MRGDRESEKAAQREEEERERDKSICNSFLIILKAHNSFLFTKLLSSLIFSFPF